MAPGVNRHPALVLVRHLDTSAVSTVLNPDAVPGAFPGFLPQVCSGSERGCGTQLEAMAVAQEACVNENTRAIAAAIVGAVIGGVAGYLFLTERGRTLRRRQIEPALEDLARELSGFSATLQKATGIASEGWKLLVETLGEGDARSPRYEHPHQSSPF
jgi:hypothetical protein